MPLSPDAAAEVTWAGEATVPNGRPGGLPILSRWESVSPEGWQKGIGFNSADYRLNGFNP